MRKNYDPLPGYSESGETPRQLRTPTTEAGLALGYLAEIYDDAVPAKAEEQFIPKVFGAIFDDNDIDLDAWSSQLDAAKGTEEQILGTVLLGTAYCAAAIKSDLKETGGQLAWTYAIDGLRIAAVLYSMFVQGKTAPPSMAKRGADAAHAKHRAMKQEAIQFYLENVEKYPSKDAAAEAMAGPILPVKFRTVRDWLVGIRPTGKP